MPAPASHLVLTFEQRLSQTYRARHGMLPHQRPTLRYPFVQQRQLIARRREPGGPHETVSELRLMSYKHLTDGGILRVRRDCAVEQTTLRRVFGHPFPNPLKDFPNGLVGSTG